MEHGKDAVPAGDDDIVRLGLLFRDVFHLPASAGVEVAAISGEGQTHGAMKTGVTVNHLGRTSLYTLPGAPGELDRDDVTRFKDSMVAEVVKKNPLAGRLLKFLGWWSIFAGSFVVFGVCPICGAVGCPVGIGVTGILAGALAGVKEFGGKAARFVAGRLGFGKLRRGPDADGSGKNIQ